MMNVNILEKYSMHTNSLHGMLEFSFLLSPFVLTPKKGRKMRIPNGLDFVNKFGILFTSIFSPEKIALHEKCIKVMQLQTEALISSHFPKRRVDQRV